VLSSLLYLALAALLLNSTWSAPTVLQAGRGSDPQLVLWLLGWFPFAVQHGHMPLLSSYVDYPLGVNLMWNTAFTPLAALVAPVTSAAGAVLASNLLTALSLAASALAAFFAIRRYVRRPWAAFVGGLLYGFSPFMVGQALGHPQLTAAFTPPLILLLMDELVVRQRHSALWLGVLLGVVASLQLLIAEELLATEALVGVLALCVLAAIVPGEVRSRAAHVGRGIAAAAATGLLLSAVPIGVQFLGPQQVHGGIWDQRLFVSDLLGFVVPSPMQALRPGFADAISQRFTAGLYEWNAYLGLPLIILLVLLARRARKNRLVQFSALMILIVAALSMGPLLRVAGVMTPIPVGLAAVLLPLIAPEGTNWRWLVYPFVCAWLALTLMPVLNQALPSRLMLYAFLFAALMVGIFVDELPLPQRSWRPLAGWAALAVVFISLLPRQPFPVTEVRVPAFFQGSDVHRIPAGSVALIAPFSRQWHADAMVWQAASGMRFRMPEGDVIVPGPSMNPPASKLGALLTVIEEGKVATSLSEDMRPDLLADLHRWQVATVVVGPMSGRAQAEELFQWLLNRPAQQIGDVDVWWDVSS
jgi:hypothetical protein